MPKTILITGSTDGLGLATAKRLTELGHHVLWHGRSSAKLAKLEAAHAEGAEPPFEGYAADLSRLADVERLAHEVSARHERLDVLVNNAGVYGASGASAEGLDLRFAVNAVAPYLLTRLLLPRLGPEGRVLNLSSAAQARVDPEALRGRRRLTDHDAYAQSKLALTMWTRVLADELGEGGPTLIAVNPGSLLATKMVRSAFGVPGKDLGIGSGVLARLALSDEVASRSGDYFDNDEGRFALPHPDALDPATSQNITRLVHECSILRS